MYLYFVELRHFSIALILILFSTLTSFSQEYTVVFDGLEGRYSKTAAKLDSTSAVLEANRLVRSLKTKGHWLAQIDEVVRNEDTLKFTIFQGKKFEKVHVQLDMGNLDGALTLRKSKTETTLTNSDQIENHVDGIIDFYENNGYPFASLQIDSAEVSDDFIFLRLSVDPGMEIRYDSVSVAPENFISDRFAVRYFGFSHNQLYNERSIKEIEGKVANLTFAELENVTVSYQLKKAKVDIDLKPIKSNTMDGILGMIPKEGGGVEFNGEFNLRLNNLFKSAKSLVFYWERLRPESQVLNVGYTHPLLLGSPLNLNLSFDQLKQDTAFSNRTLQVGLDYFPKPRLKMKLGYKNKLGNQLDPLSEESGDFTINTYGIGILYQNLNHSRIPTKGTQVELDGGIGNKELGSQDLPDQSTQYDVEARIQYYLPTGKRSNLYFDVQGALLVNDYLYLNDLYRLGGLRSIRGFNEGEFFASQYLVGRVEWRFFLDKESYLLAFFDQGFLSYDIIGGQFSDQPAGLGVGMQMNGPGGIFQILYGLGKRNEEGFSFDSSKIHFGYTAIF